VGSRNIVVSVVTRLWVWRSGARILAALARNVDTGSGAHLTGVLPRI